METATVLVKTEHFTRDKDEYYTIQLPEDFYESHTIDGDLKISALKRYRKEIENLYRHLTGHDYIMAKFDKIEKYFDQ